MAPQDAQQRGGDGAVARHRGRRVLPQCCSGRQKRPVNPELGATVGRRQAGLGGVSGEEAEVGVLHRSP